MPAIIFRSTCMCISKIKKVSLDILFPIKCLGCKKEGEWICAHCMAHISIKSEHMCPSCEKMLTPDGRKCLTCKNLVCGRIDEFPLDALIAACSYSERLVAHAVHLFKYRFVSDLHVPLGNMLAESLLRTNLPLPDIVIPVPLHKRRLRWRGFNQAELLAKHLASTMLPSQNLLVCANLLKRTRYTQPQMIIKKLQQRKLNVSGAFSVTDAVLIKNKNILLVDDIVTTGATLSECAHILKKSGAGDVFAVVIARRESQKATRI